MPTDPEAVVGGPQTDDERPAPRPRPAGTLPEPTVPREPAFPAGRDGDDAPEPAPTPDGRADLLRPAAVPSPISVLVAASEPDDPLDGLLACLAEQQLDGPGEVLVAHPSGRPPEGLPPSTGALRVRPVDVDLSDAAAPGARRAAALNAALRQARGPAVVRCDPAVRPSPGLLAAHAAWHGAHRDLLTVSPPRLAPEAAGGTTIARRLALGETGGQDLGLPAEVAAWLQQPAAAPATPTQPGPATPQQPAPVTPLNPALDAADAAVLGVRLELLAEAGGLRPQAAGEQWDWTALELAWRLACAGAQWVAVADPPCWLVGAEAAARSARSADDLAGEPPAGHLVAHPLARPRVGGTRWAVADVQVTVDPGAADADQLAAAAVAALASHGLAVELVVPLDAGDARTGRLAAWLGDDPRVRLTATPPAPGTPVLVHLPRPAVLGERSLLEVDRRLREEPVGRLRLALPRVPAEEALGLACTAASQARLARAVDAGLASSGEPAEMWAGERCGERFLAGEHVGLQPPAARPADLRRPTGLDEGRLQRALDEARAELGDVRRERREQERRAERLEERIAHLEGQVAALRARRVVRAADRVGRLARRDRAAGDGGVGPDDGAAGGGDDGHAGPDGDDREDGQR